MSGYAPRLTPATGVHDPLHASAIVLDDGRERLCVISADLISFPTDLTDAIRAEIASRLGVVPSAIMLHCTHTHGGPFIGTFRCMGSRNAAYEEILRLKLAGIAEQAAAQLQPARLTYGEAPVQIGANRRSSGPRAAMGRNFAGSAHPQLYKRYALPGREGRTFAMLFCHACHPTTMGGDNYQFTAEWPGVAAAELMARFERDGIENGIERDAVAVPREGCRGDINPLRRGSWEAVRHNGTVVAGERIRPGGTRMAISLASSHTGRSILSYRLCRRLTLRLR